MEEGRISKKYQRRDQIHRRRAETTTLFCMVTVGCGSAVHSKGKVRGLGGKVEENGTEWVRSHREGHEVSETSVEQ